MRDFVRVWLCPFHTVADAVASWGGAEPFTARASSATLDGHTCEVCSTSASRVYNLVWKAGA